MLAVSLETPGASAVLTAEQAIAKGRTFTRKIRYDVFSVSEICHVNVCYFFLIQAVTGAHIVATDTWVSMGQEAEAAKRIKDYEGYQVKSCDVRALLLSHDTTTRPGNIALIPHGENHNPACSFEGTNTSQVIVMDSSFFLLLPFMRVHGGSGRDGVILGTYRVHCRSRILENKGDGDFNNCRPPATMHSARVADVS